MSLLVWILVLAVVNACLGYALAVYLGYGPPGLKDGWEALFADRPLVEPGDEETELALPFEGPLAASPAKQAPPKDQVSSSKGPVETGLSGDSRDQEPAPAVHAQGTEDGSHNEAYVETSILKLNIAMMTSAARATEIDSRLRECRGHSDAEAIRQCWLDLKKDCETYLAEQSAAAEEFENRIGELGELRAMGEEIKMANLEQAAQIETTLSNLTHMDFASDLEAANTRLLEELKHLRIARHRLRDSREAAFLAVARQENRLDKIEKRLFHDPLTRMYNRIGLETTVSQRLEESRRQARQMSAALVDLDAFGQIDDQHGPLIGDRVLYQVAALLQKHIGEADLVGRFAGQRFLVVTADVGPRVATRNVEFIRQSIERATFRHGEQAIRVTLTAAVTEITPDDTEANLVQRLEKTLQQAKEHGPNNALFHDGRKAEPIESPNLGAEPVEIVI